MAATTSTPEFTAAPAIEELRALPKEVLTILNQNGFSEQLFNKLSASINAQSDSINRVTGTVQPPQPTDISNPPDPSSQEAARLARIGLDAIAKGQLAFVVLAGGMATRMGGVVKALVPVFDNISFLDLRIAENRTWSKRAGTPIPLWIMTSHATDSKLQQAIAESSPLHASPNSITTFQQNISIRITPNGSLFRHSDGTPSFYSPGHGDLPDAIKRCGLLRQFVNSGGKHLWIANIDNLGAGIDPTILGWHIEHGAPMSVEVVNKAANDRGGIPVRWNEKPVVLEEFRLPTSFDPHQVTVFNTNTFLISATHLSELNFDFTWFKVEKGVDGAKAIQFERLIGELTTPFDTRFIRVPRDGAKSRFIPVKNLDELAANRELIREVASLRGMLP
ncbi:MAG: UTP--glucose-1-phosphate uridylyltransferase [Polyangiaceae bacterium]|nr:UTP--glucose-1-phosphate uridylyltransferase [Polyangiaceae bacterium]